MHYERSSHTISLLANGKVLAISGVSEGTYNTAELYDPSTGTWMAIGNKHIETTFHAASVLFDGKVLVSGGIGRYENSINESELCDPVTGLWTLTDG